MIGKIKDTAKSYINQGSLQLCSIENLKNNSKVSLH